MFLWFSLFQLMLLLFAVGKTFLTMYIQTFQILYVCLFFSETESHYEFRNFFFYCGRNQTRNLMLAWQALCHWAVSPAFRLDLKAPNSQDSWRPSYLSPLSTRITDVSPCTHLQSFLNLYFNSLCTVTFVIVFFVHSSSPVYFYILRTLGLSTITQTTWIAF